MEELKKFSEEMCKRVEKHCAIMESMGRLETAIMGLEDLMNKINGHSRPHDTVQDVKSPEPSLMDVLDTVPQMLDESNERIIEITSVIRGDLF